MGAVARRDRTRELVRVPSEGTASEEASDAAITVGLDKSIRINLARLKPPTNSYDADYAWVARRNGAMSIFFGKADADNPDTLRTRVEVRYPFEAFVYHFWKSVQEGFRERMNKYLASAPADSERTALHPEQWKADRDHSDWANFDYVSHSGSQAAVDFFLLSPGGVALFVQGQGSSALSVRPILRVLMTTRELSLLLNACEPFPDELVSQLPLPH